MITTRLALITIRIVLAVVAIVYAVLKAFVAPETTPLFGIPSGVESNIPFNTNPTFALVMISLATLVAVLLLFTTVKQTLHDRRVYRVPAPFSSPLQIALLSLFACFSVYYFVVALLSDGRWYYSGTLALCAVILALYEGRQYADLSQVKVHPVDH